jgi:uncharacterized membrane protein
MNASLWAKFHGGVTHFPIALTMTSMVCDLAGALIRDDPGKARKAGLHAAGLYTLLLAAGGSMAAIISGIFLSHGALWGSGNLAQHHLFLWPAFGLLIALAVWRLAMGHRAYHSPFRLYLAGAILTSALMGAAGYWGGELLLNG